MIVACPHCAAVYELPRHLLGPGGAAVRCPHCTGEFTLGADGEVISAAGAREAAIAPPAPAPAPAPAAARTAAPAAVPATASAAASVAEPVAKPARKPTPQRTPATQGTPATQSSAARAPAAAATAPAAEVDSARAIARRVLDELVARKGTAMKDANARGRLLSEFGPDLIAAFDAFRKESGLVSPAPFRDELLGRFGIDLRPRAD
jgi:predicted Zn finger-like uncharacterized protein